MNAKEFKAFFAGLEAGMDGEVLSGKQMEALKKAVEELREEGPPAITYPPGVRDTEFPGKCGEPVIVPYITC